jgi:predicted outer membrane repeat protein
LGRDLSEHTELFNVALLSPLNMMFKKIALVILISVSSPLGLIYAEIIYVPTDQPTIQAGIDVAKAGDIVLIADGVYTGPGNRDLDFKGKAITVRSENGPHNCIIDCQGNGRGFYFSNNETRSSVVSGLTITNGFASHGGAVRSNASPTISNCKIIANRAEHNGGGIYCSIRRCKISNCEISNNMAAKGGGIYVGSSTSEVTNCTIVGNLAESGGGGIFITIVDPLILPTITHSILWGNTDDAHLGDQIQPAIYLNVSYSNVDQDGFTGAHSHNIRQNPLFVNEANNDFNLSTGSPCIDKGLFIRLHAPDLNGNYRVFDGDGNGIPIVDIGAYEYGSIPIFQGDFDSSYSVDLADALLALKIYAGIQSPEGFNLCAAIRTPEQLSMHDIVYVLQLISQLR